MAVLHYLVDRLPMILVRKARAAKQIKLYPTLTTCIDSNHLLELEWIHQLQLNVPRILPSVGHERFPVELGCKTHKLINNSPLKMYQSPYPV